MKEKNNTGEVDKYPRSVWTAALNMYLECLNRFDLKQTADCPSNKNPSLYVYVIIIIIIGIIRIRIRIIIMGYSS